MIFHNNCLCYCDHVEFFCNVFLVPKIDSSVHNIKHKSCNGKKMSLVVIGQAFVGMQHVQWFQFEEQHTDLVKFSVFVCTVS